MAACAICAGPMAPDALSDRHPGCAAAWPTVEDGGGPEDEVCGSACPRINAVPPLLCNKPKGHDGSCQEVGREPITWTMWRNS